MMQALAVAAADDLTLAISEGDPTKLRILTKAAVGSMATYLIACVEHDDASRHAPPFGGL
jgi:hypothetical protein